MQLAETRESAGQLAEAADLYKKAAGEAADKPFVLQAALYREAAALTDLALVEPERIKDARDKLTRFVQAYPTGRHIVSAREDLAKLQVNAGDFKAAEANIAELARLPGAPSAPRSCGPAARQARVARRGHLRARPPDRRVPRRLGPRSARPAWPRPRASSG